MIFKTFGQYVNEMITVAVTSSVCENRRVLSARTVEFCKNR